MSNQDNSMTRKFSALYRGKTITVEASSSYQAQIEAQVQFQSISPRQRVDRTRITVMLQDVKHTADF